jgi:hypothetical protein
MKSTIFGAGNMSIVSHDNFDRICTVSVPTLSAYAVEWAEFTPPPHVDAGYRVLRSSVDFSIEGDFVNFGSPVVFSLMGDLGNSSLLIHYHGVRDYEALFPQVTEHALKARLGRFYEEAEVTFESRAWLSFALMAAAVYEGLLASRLGDGTASFSELVRRSLSEGVIDEQEERILSTARESRNLVHAGRFAEPCVTRTGAMDMRTVMDGLIRKLAVQRIGD